MPDADRRTDTRTIVVVGVGEDGWAGLGEPARSALADADVVVGGQRQVELVRAHVATVQTWSTDLVGEARRLPVTHTGRRVAVLASGDPMFHGIGSTLVRELGAEHVHVLAYPSSVSLACARLGWPLEHTPVLSAVGRPLAPLRALLHPGARVLVLVADEGGAAEVAEMLCEAGCTGSLTVLERLGGPAERVTSVPVRPAGTARHARLAVVAVHCTDVARVLSRVPGLPDDVYVTDGVITKREVRAVTLSALQPVPGQLLWDVGAGSGSIGVEWMRTGPTCRAVAVEPRTDRCGLVRANAERLGVPGLEVVQGSAPAALAGLPAPDAVFVGGGVTVPDVVRTCLIALRPGGRLVANAVTIESEAALVGWHARVGGTLRRIDVANAEPIGSFHSFRPALTVTQWAHTVPEDPA